MRLGSALLAAMGKRPAAKQVARAAVAPPGDDAGSSAHPGAAGSSAHLGTVFEPVVNINANHMEYINECLRKIKEHVVFADIENKAPLTQAQGGREAPFDLAGFTANLAQPNGTSKAGCNLFWQDFAFDHLTSHIPIKRSKVEKMASSRFSTPTHCTDVHISCSAKYNPLAHKGRLRRLSPPEPVHAMLMAIRRDIDAGSAATLKAWRNICLSTCMVFEKCESNEDFHFRHLQLRESPGIDFELVRQSSLQRIIDVAQFQKRHLEETKVTRRAGRCGGVRYFGCGLNQGGGGGAGRAMEQLRTITSDGHPGDTENQKREFYICLFGGLWVAGRAGCGCVPRSP